MMRCILQLLVVFSASCLVVDSQTDADETLELRGFLHNKYRTMACWKDSAVLSRNVLIDGKKANVNDFFRVFNAGILTEWSITRHNAIELFVLLRTVLSCEYCKIMYSFVTYLDKYLSGCKIDSQQVTSKFEMPSVPTYDGRTEFYHCVKKTLDELKPLLKDIKNMIFTLVDFDEIAQEFVSPRPDMMYVLLSWYLSLNKLIGNDEYPLKTKLEAGRAKEEYQQTAYYIETLRVIGVQMKIALRGFMMKNCQSARETARFEDVLNSKSTKNLNKLVSLKIIRTEIKHYVIPMSLERYVVNVDGRHKQFLRSLTDNKTIRLEWNAGEWLSPEEVYSKYVENSTVTQNMVKYENIVLRIMVKVVHGRIMGELYKMIQTRVLEQRNEIHRDIVAQMKKLIDHLRASKCRKTFQNEMIELLYRVEAVVPYVLAGELMSTRFVYLYDGLKSEDELSFEPGKLAWGRAADRLSDFFSMFVLQYADATNLNRNIVDAIGLQAVASTVRLENSVDYRNVYMTDWKPEYDENHEVCKKAASAKETTRRAIAVIIRCLEELKDPEEAAEEDSSSADAKANGKENQTDSAKNEPDTASVVDTKAANGKGKKTNGVKNEPDAGSVVKTGGGKKQDGKNVNNQRDGGKDDAAVTVDKPAPVPEAPPKVDECEILDLSTSIKTVAAAMDAMAKGRKKESERKLDAFDKTAAYKYPAHNMHTVHKAADAIRSYHELNESLKDLRDRIVDLFASACRQGASGYDVDCFLRKLAFGFLMNVENATVFDRRAQTWMSAARAERVLAFLTGVDDSLSKYQLLACKRAFPAYIGPEYPRGHAWNIETAAAFNRAESDARVTDYVREFYENKATADVQHTVAHNRTHAVGLCLAAVRDYHGFVDKAAAAFYGRRIRFRADDGRPRTVMDAKKRLLDGPFDVSDVVEYQRLTLNWILCSLYSMFVRILDGMIDYDRDRQSFLADGKLREKLRYLTAAVPLSGYSPRANLVVAEFELALRVGVKKNALVQLNATIVQELNMMGVVESTLPGSFGYNDCEGVDVSSYVKQVCGKIQLLEDLQFKRLFATFGLGPLLGEWPSATKVDKRRG